MDESRRFTWWWPSSNAGNAVFWVMLVLAGLTIFIAPFFFMINVVFWYLIAVGVRFVFLHATHKTH